jgi:hypothetical protein
MVWVAEYQRQWAIEKEDCKHDVVWSPSRAAKHCALAAARAVEALRAMYATSHDDAEIDKAARLMLDQIMLI